MSNSNSNSNLHNICKNHDFAMEQRLLSSFIIFPKTLMSLKKTPLKLLNFIISDTTFV